MLALIFAVEKLQASQSQQQVKIQWPRPFLYIVWFQVLPAAHQVEQVTRFKGVCCLSLPHSRLPARLCRLSTVGDALNKQT